LAGLPLAVYREVSAHLCQVDQVQTDLVSQQSQTFDYGTSQIDSLLIHYPEHAASQVYERVQQILAYYSDRYGAWEVTDLTQPGSEA
jgi:hypothetical protein